MIIAIALKSQEKVQAPQANTSNNQEEQPEEPAPIPEPEPTFNKNLHSIDDPNSIWVVTNKKRPLPNGFIPPNLVTIGGTKLQKIAADEANQLVGDAAAAGVTIRPISGYRSYNSQVSLYNSYVARDGQSKADTYSARPGFSEHQTGLVVDMGDGGRCDLEICYANTPGGKWIAENAHKYGFIVRYLEGKTPITGYQYEPWHLRYVGVELATELKTNGQTMEEFFGLPPAPGY